MFNECRGSVWEEEKILEMHSGDGCTSMLVYLMSVNGALKTVKMVNFMLCIFYYNFFK